MYVSVCAFVLLWCLFCGQFRPTGGENRKNSFKNCYEIQLNGDTASGVRTVYPIELEGDSSSSFEVSCDQETDEGGWTVIQRRSPLPVRENFTRSWSEYEKGFGDLSGEFWIGLQNIHALTSSTQMELRVDLEDWEGATRWAKYASFHVGDAASKYTLRIADYSGDAGDGMTPSYGDGALNLNGMKFSTYDEDNDLFTGKNCAGFYKGGWWYNRCFLGRLNGLPSAGEGLRGIIWQPFRGWHSSLKKASMKVRPVTKKEEITEPTTLKPELDDTVTEEVTVLPTTLKPSKNCAEVKLNGGSASGVYLVHPYLSNSLSNYSLKVFCDQLTDDGGWTVIQNRDDLPVRTSFERSWQDYVGGFGDLEGEFWLGLDNLHALTSSTPMQLRVDMEDWEGKKRWAKYSEFRVGDPASKYLLSVGGYEGDAGDEGKEMTWNNGSKFSTMDQDNNFQPLFNCTKENRGGWWFYKGWICTYVNPNAIPLKGKYAESPGEGIYWSPFRGLDYSLKKISLKIRPV